MVAFGITTILTDRTLQPADMARAVEDRGFESLFFPDHTHIPVSRDSQYVIGTNPSREHWAIYDPFVALAAAAAVTQHLTLGTGILLLSERDPIVAAKQLATLDHLAGGRLCIGIGAGWNAEELADHGVAYKDRWKVVRERVLAMRALWTQDEAEFHGDFVDFPPTWSDPKPLSPNGPPILLGAESRYAFGRVVDYCDGWMPTFRPGDVRPKDFPAWMQQLRDAAARAGRDFDSLDLTVIDLGRSERRAREMIEVGFRRVAFGVPPVPPVEQTRLLDYYADLARRLS